MTARGANKTGYGVGCLTMLKARILGVSLLSAGLSGTNQADGELSLELGAGVAATQQAYTGDWAVLPAPSIAINYRGFSLRTRGPGLVADLVPSRLLSLGPFVQYSGGRTRDELPAEYNGQGDIPASVEVGLSIGSGIPLRVIGVPVPGILTAGFDLANTLPGGHETTSVGSSLGWVNPVTQQLTLIGSLGTKWGSEANMSTFFGVSGDVGQDITAYEPEAGLKDLSLTFIAAYQHTERLSTTWLVSGSRYQGDAARSPLVDEMAAPDRFFVLWGISYSWTFD